MKILRNALLLIVVLPLAAALLAGCAGEDASKSTGGAQTGDTQTAGDWKAGLDEDVIAGLSELSETDRAAALAQKVCPVTDKPLGSMGKPPKVTVEGREVFLCCAGCEEEIKSNPEKYLAKLNSPE